MVRRDASDSFANLAADLYGTLLEDSSHAEQLGRAAQPTFELSKGRTIVGDRRVPNFFISDSEINGGRYVGLESD
jgi:hypothetical protein